MSDGMTKENRRPRIGLISPYTGGNLGDAAIIESARANLVKVLPEVELVLIALNCERISELHGLESFPLTAIKRSFYFNPTPKGSGENQTEGESTGDDTSSPTRTLRAAAKKAAGFVPLVLPLARGVRDTARSLSIEIKHLRETGRLLQGLDALIVAGGGQFDDEFGGPWGHPYAMFKWVRQARRKDVPVYFLGVGVCEVRHALTRWFLRRSLHGPTRVSLRDAGSLEILHKVGVKRVLPPCPDLAFGLYRNGGSREVTLPTDTAAHIGLSPIPFGRPGSWPTENKPLFDHYWAEFTRLTQELLQSGHTVTLFATDDPDHILAKKIHKELITAGIDQNRFNLLPRLTFSELLDALRSFHVVVAGRLHGVILSHISGVPVLAISYHRKVRAHMEDMAQEKYCLEFEEFSAARSRAHLNEMLEQRPAVTTELAQFCTERRMRLQKEFSLVGEELQAGRNRKRKN